MLVTTVVAALLFPVVNQAHGPDQNKKPSKLDRVLRKAADAGDTSTKRVIVRARAGKSAAVADRVKKHGDRIEADHYRLEAFTATVSGKELRALDADPDVASVSIDAVITADSTESSSATSTDVQNLLTASLGLVDAKYDGEQVGVAVIDSGLELSEDCRAGAQIALSISRPTVAPHIRTTITVTGRMSRRSSRARGSNPGWKSSDWRTGNQSACAWRGLPGSLRRRGSSA
jgi:hypothetical protein